MPINNKNILITGISGFIGHSLADEIIKQDLPYNIYGIDIKDVPNNLKDKIHFEKVDIRDSRQCAEYFAKHSDLDGIIHLAAVSRVVIAEENSNNCVETNGRGVLNVLQYIKNTPNCWFVYGSSREVYGELLEEKRDFSEYDDCLPINIYGCYKLLGEEWVKQMCRKYMILRFCNVYGNDYDLIGDDKYGKGGRVIPSFILKAIHNKKIEIEGGEQIIDFTHITDTVWAIIEVIKQLCDETLQNEILHISPGVGNKITEIVDILKKITGKELDVDYKEKRHYDVQHFIGNPAKHKQLLGDRIFITLETGLKMTYELYLKKFS